MATNCHWPYKDTAISGGAEPAFKQTPLNFSADFAKLETKANQAIITNSTSPLDRPETIRYAFTTVANIYSKTGIDPSYYGPSRKGFSILAQVNDNLSVTDDVTKKTIVLPLSAHIVMKGACHEAINGEMMTILLKRLIGALCEQGAATPDARLNSLIRGALLPKVLV